MRRPYHALPEVVADLLRLAAPELADELDLSTLERMPGEAVDTRLLARASDMVWCVRFKRGRLAGGTRSWLLLLVEFQSTVDRRMAQRVREYTSMLLECRVPAATGCERAEKRLDPGQLGDVEPSPEPAGAGRGQIRQQREQDRGQAARGHAVLQETAREHREVLGKDHAGLEAGSGPAGRDSLAEPCAKPTRTAPAGGPAPTNPAGDREDEGRRDSAVCGGAAQGDVPARALAALSMAM